MRIITFDRLRPEKGVPYSRDHLRRMVKAGSFPAPISVGEARIGWIEAEVDRWLDERVSQRTNKAA